MKVPDLRSKEISRKFTHFLFASIVSFRLWSVKMLHICFLIISMSLGDSLNAPRPSSLYNPRLLLYCEVIAAVGSSLILTWVTYVSCPDLFAHLCIVNEISIYENLQFRISFMTFCYVTLPIYIHTPEGYSFSRKLYGINVRNLSTPPGTWYFLNTCD